MKNFSIRSLELNNELLEIRRFIHANAECGADLPITTKYVVERLNSLGLETEEISKCGIVTTIRGAKPGKTIMLRADMDALPMNEDNDLHFSSKTSCAHTCGHDIHTAMLLGAAKMLLERKDEVSGNIKLMFQPAEEIFTGARAMIDNGLMNNPIVDAALQVHIMSELPLGKVTYRKDNGTSSCDAFQITIRGIGCHGAQPHNGRDVINVGSNIVIALQSLISRETPPDKVAVLTVCQFTAGNSTNIMPEAAVLKGTLRTYGKELREKLFNRFQDIVKYTGKTFGVEIELDMLSSVPSIEIDNQLLEELVGYVSKIDYNFTFDSDYLITASDDFGYVSELVPTVFFAIGAMPDKESIVYPNHNSKVVFNEKSIPMGAAIFAECAFQWLKNNA